jgi:hypothetical protein
VLNWPRIDATLRLNSAKTDDGDMPALLRKLVIFAAVDGLILQFPGNGPRHNGNNESSSIRIDYSTSRISPLSAYPTDQNERDSGLEVFGLVGKQLENSS